VLHNIFYIQQTVYVSLLVKCLALCSFAATVDHCVLAVDTSEAGFGDLDVCVTQSGIGVPVKRNQVSLTLARYSFQAKLPKQHLIHITFNGENIPGKVFFNSVYLFEKHHSVN